MSIFPLYDVGFWGSNTPEPTDRIMQVSAGERTLHLAIPVGVSDCDAIKAAHSRGWCVHPLKPATLPPA